MNIKEFKQPVFSWQLYLHHLLNIFEPIANKNSDGILQDFWAIFAVKINKWIKNGFFCTDSLFGMLNNSF